MAKKRLRGEDTSSPLDRITEDGILCLIIASLMLKEAVRTSILSRRWRNIWTCLPNLNFCSHETFRDPPYRKFFPVCHRPLLPHNEKEVAPLREKFIATVNSVLEKHQGIGVDTFPIDYYFHDIHSHHLDQWVQFAVASKTKELRFVLDKLYFLRYDYQRHTLPKPYEFPCHVLGSSSIESLHLTSCSLKPCHGFGGLAHLKNLNLYGVDVTEEDMRCILSNCLTLESLVFDKCQHLETLSISLPLSRLKHLMVKDCHDLRKINIDAANLTRMTYEGYLVDFIFGDFSQLKEAVINFNTEYMDGALTKLSNNFPRLEILRFSISGSILYYRSGEDLPRNFNRFIHLRDLEWTVPSLLINKKGGLCLASILSAAPFLETFNVHYWYGITLSKWEGQEQMRPSPHKHLKSVEFSGFIGHKWQIIFAIYILKCAIKLESMALKKNGNRLWGDSEKYFKTNIKYLELEVPSHVKLEIS